MLGMKITFITIASLWCFLTLCTCAKSFGETYNEHTPVRAKLREVFVVLFGMIIMQMIFFFALLVND